MRIYFDIIFVVLNVILFALNFHFALESKSSKSYTYAILGMTFAIAAIVLLLSTASNPGARQDKTLADRRRCQSDIRRQ